MGAPALIETERLLLRQPRVEDAPGLLEAFADPEAMRFIDDVMVPVIVLVPLTMSVIGTTTEFDSMWYWLSWLSDMTWVCPLTPTPIGVFATE